MPESLVMDQEPAAFRALDERYLQVPIAELGESPLNPRKTFLEPKLKELAASLAQKGLIEPLVVRELAKPRGAIKFEIVAGARRFRAASSIGMTHLPVVVRAYTDAQVIEIMAIENGQRDDVPPLEEAAGYQQLLGLATGYSPALIADRIGRTEAYVRARLRLLAAIPKVQELLTAGRIGVEHAEILSRLTETDQRRAISTEKGGLFEGDYAIDFDPDRKSGDKTSAYDRVKVVSVRQLRQWVARHIRFDVAQAAAAQPLEFGPIAAKVEQAAAQPGKGRHVVAITFEHYCPDAARADDERTYGASAWRRAEGKDGTPTCAHAVLGVVVAGVRYGEAFPVCLARDRCETHWRKELAEKRKAETLRARGQGKQAARVDAQAKARAQREADEQQRREARWKAFAPALRTAVHTAVAKVPATLPKALFAAVLQREALPTHTTPAQLAKALLQQHVDQDFGPYMSAYREAKLVAFAKLLGVDVQACEPKREMPPAAAKTAKKGRAA